MRTIETAHGVVFGALIFIVLSSILPFYGLLEEMRIILTVTTFLFGIIAGFVIASRVTRYSRFRELLTNETGYLITLYQYSLFMDQKFQNKIKDVIDSYLIESFLYEIYEYHEKTEKMFYTIFDTIREYKPTTSQQESTLNAMKNIIKDLLKDREELYLLGKDRISFLLKSTLILLAGIMLFGLYLIRIETLYFHIITVLLSTSILMILFLVRDLDRLKLSSYVFSYGIYNRVFDAIGKLHVYTSDSSIRGMPIPTEDEYRFGVISYKNKVPYYKEIKTVKKTKLQKHFTL
jgi:hypothetical protein